MLYTNNPIIKHKVGLLSLVSFLLKTYDQKSLAYKEENDSVFIIKINWSILIPK